MRGFLHRRIYLHISKHPATRTARKGKRMTARVGEAWETDEADTQGQAD
jgi:hypothetical protein